MKTLIDVITLSCQFLQQKGIENPRRDVERLIAWVLSLSRLDLYLQFDRPLQENELTSIREGVKRLAAHEPIQYIEGNVAFHHGVFEVTPSVLIPRPETELLVELSLSCAASIEHDEISVLDLCCGSGCIGISLKKAIPKAHVVLSDISDEALLVASRNAVKNDVNVEIVKSDFFENLRGRKFDIIVSNPPYISEGEFLTLDTSVRNFEPKIALVSGPSGLESYQLIAQNAKRFLKSNASIFLEIGHTQGESVSTLFGNAGYRDVVVKSDFSDNDRFIIIHT
jgi:release factor glutamine methyltransferase